MADKYCDNGLYGACEFTASRSSSTLIVSAVSSGALALGAVISSVSGGAIPDDTVYITAFGTGTGGTGTYTVSASGTVASESMVAKHGGIRAIPTWGVAQEGDGTATGAATPATVSIDLSAATASAGNTISIMGAVLTCVASGASTNQFNAGSGATLVSNLVAAINRTTNSATVAAQATGWQTPKVQDAVFARIGSPTTTLDIMTRAGSATYNSSVVAQSGISGVTGPWTFSGGAGGAWGHLMNALAVTLPSAVGVYLYGLWCAQLPIAGVVAGGDAVWVRANGTIWYLGSGNLYPAMSASLGASGGPVHFFIDSGNKWPGDSSSAEFTLLSKGGTKYLLGAAAGSAVRVRGKRIGASLWNLKIVSSGISGNTYLSVSNKLRVSGFNFYVDSTSTGPLCAIAVGTTSQNEGWEVADGTIKHNRSDPFLAVSNTSTKFAYRNLTLDNGAAVVPNSGLFSGNLTNGAEGLFDGIQCVNFVTGSQLYASANSAASLTFVDCLWGGVTLRGPYNSGAGTYQDYNAFFAGYSQRGGRDFWFDGPRGFVQWDSAVSQPTLNALLLDGVTPWSWLLIPSRTVVNFAAPFVTPVISKINSLADGARTFTVQLAISDALSWTKKDISLVINYYAATGERITLDSFDVAGGALTTSSATWSQESGGKVTYSSGGTLYHNKYQIALSTPTGLDLPEGAEVTATIQINTSVANTTQIVFVDPDITIT